MALKEWNHDVVLGLFGDAALGSINCSVILWSLGGVVFVDNNQQQHDDTVYYTIKNFNINMRYL
jgi:hypothetical protein